MFLRLRLSCLDQDNQHRRRLARIYSREIIHPEVRVPEWPEADENSHVWHLYVVRCERRLELQKFLAEGEIQTLIHYPTPPHQQRAFASWRHISLPVTERIHQTVLSLPISPVHTESEIVRVIERVNAFT